VTGVALTGGRLVDGCGGPPVDGAAVLIAGERILWTGRAADAVIPDSFRRIDTTGHTILPGLVDAHATSLPSCAAPSCRPRTPAASPRSSSTSSSGPA
jgi:cytosine/adenosine deaminase-related metal-dependent hydrolase